MKLKPRRINLFKSIQTPKLKGNQKNSPGVGNKLIKKETVKLTLMINNKKGDFQTVAQKHLWDYFDYKQEIYNNEKNVTRVELTRNELKRYVCVAICHYIYDGHVSHWHLIRCMMIIYQKYNCDWLTLTFS